MENCINHTGATTDGYGVLKRFRKLVGAHRWSYCIDKKIQLDEIKGLVVMHICDNRLCINPKHLLLGTHADNCADKVKKGRQARGEKQGNSKLKNHQVVLIKYLFTVGATNVAIAKEYGVSTMCVSRIRSGKTWGFL